MFKGLSKSKYIKKKNMDNQSKKKFYGIFNAKIIEFLNDLIKIFPGDTEFKMYKNAVNLIKMADEKKPLQLYNTFVTAEYKQNILDKNEDFFLQHDYNEILSSDIVKNSDFVKKEIDGNVNNKIVNKLKGYWGELSDENKEFIWSYFNLFLKISDKVNS